MCLLNKENRRLGVFTQSPNDILCFLAFQRRTYVAAPKCPGSTLRDDAALARLSDRQNGIVRLMSEGKTNKEIKRPIGHSNETANAHVSTVMHQLEFTNRAEATFLAFKLGFPVKLNDRRADHSRPLIILLV